MGLNNEKLWEAELQAWLSKKSLSEREDDLNSQNSHPVVVSNHPIGQYKFLLDENFEYKIVSPNIAQADQQEDEMLAAFQSMSGPQKLEAKRFKYPKLINAITKQFNLVSKQGCHSAETRLDMTTVDLPLQHPLNGVFHSFMSPVKVFAKKHWVEQWVCKFAEPDKDWRHNQLKAIEARKIYEQNSDDEKEFWEARKGWVVWILTSLKGFHYSASVQKEIIETLPDYLGENTTVK
ncbi:MAG: hypothetical protein VXW71_08585 [Actinomycetota bacterium]|nr:hypothetical protein [Actinomycetota bacterium]